MRRNRKLIAGIALAAAVIMLISTFSTTSYAAAQPLSPTMTVTALTTAAAVNNTSKKGLQFGAVSQVLSYNYDNYTPVPYNIYNTENVYFHLNLMDLIYECDSSNPDKLYSYNGKNYAFNETRLTAFDPETFKKYGGKTITVVLVSAGILPGLTYETQTSAVYYALNTWDSTHKSNVQKLLNKIAAKVGKGIDYWVVGNEIDMPSSWNEMGSVTLDTYTSRYTTLLRMVYNTMAKQNANVSVLVPFDQGWTHSGDGHFSSKAILDKIKALTASNDFRWGVALHPYPVNLRNAAWWNDSVTNPYAIRDSADTDMYTMDNIGTITSTIAKNYKYNGKRRPILITEVGFNAYSNGTYNENLQAAALAYAYYKAEADPNIDLFIYNALSDSWDPNYNFGLTKADGTHRKAFDVYMWMDTIYGSTVTKSCLSTLGATSWENLIPGLKLSNFQRECRIGFLPEKPDTFDYYYYYYGDPLPGKYLYLGGALCPYTGLVKLGSSKYYADYGRVDHTYTGTLNTPYYAYITNKGVISGCAAKIVTQPKNTAAAKDAKATFSLKATGDDLTYAWYAKKVGATSFSKVASGTTSYSVTASSALHGLQVYCIVKDSHGNSVQSKTVVLTEAGQKAVISEQPKSQKLYGGDKYSFTVNAAGEGLSYAWYYKNPSDSSYTKSPTTTATFTGTATTKMNGRKVYCIVKDKYGNSVKSSVVTLNVYLPFKITAQPKSLWVKVGDTADFTITAAGSGLTYQWQYSKDSGKTWTNWGTKSTFSLEGTAARNGYMVRCIVTDAMGKKVTSSSAKLTILPTITAQPANKWAKVGETAEFTVKATGAGLSYNWQYSKDGGSTWANWGTKSTFSIEATAARNGYMFRCVISDVNGKTKTTNTVKLTILPSITAQPKSVTVQAGTTATFTVKATGAGLKYNWQYSKDGGSTWANWGTKNVFSIEATKARNGYMFRCVVSDVNGKTLTSSNVKLTVQ